MTSLWRQQVTIPWRQQVTSHSRQQVTSPCSQQVTGPWIQKVGSPWRQKVTSPLKQKVVSHWRQQVTSPHAAPVHAATAHHARVTEWVDRFKPSLNTVMNFDNHSAQGQINFGNTLAWQGFAFLWGYNRVCKVTPVILHGVASPGELRA